MVVFIAGGGHQVLESHRAAREIGERKRNVTLTLIAGVVDCYEQLFWISSFPRKGQEAIRCPVAFPGRFTFE